MDYKTKWVCPYFNNKNQYKLYMSLLQTYYDTIGTIGRDELTFVRSLLLLKDVCFIFFPRTENAISRLKI